MKHMEQEIRWEQRFSNFEKALHKLSQAVEYIKHNFLNEDEPIDESDSGYVLDEMIKEGLIQRFEYTHELAWNVMKDYATFQGNANVGGSRDATREAFQLKLFSEGKVWMDMIISRNQSSHTYNEDTADGIFSKIMNNYYPAFLEFQKNMEAKRSGEQGKLI
jgi:nucleotidyltransferase substrate binding protein (TIGR01987 family)